MKSKKWKKVILILIALGVLSGKNYAANIELLPTPVEIPTGIQSEKRQLSRYMSGYGLATQKYNLTDSISLNVKDQGEDNICWACSSNTVLETNVNKAENTNVIYDDKYLDEQINELYGKTTEDGGNALMAYSYYSTKGTPKILNGKQTNLTISDYVIFPTVYKDKQDDGTIKYTNTNAIFGATKYTEEEVKKVRSQIKEHIQTYGAVTAVTYAKRTSYYNEDMTAYYGDSSFLAPDHQVTIVGWDDSYSKENFNEEHRPSSDGAYIVMNSHGTQNYKNGFLYISYEDAYIEANVFGIREVEEKSSDEKSYEYDELGMVAQLQASGILYGANVFKRDGTTDKQKGEFINKIGLGTLGEGTYEIYVNAKDNSLTSTDFVKVMTIEKEFAGYQEIELNNPIQITGDKFVVATRAIDGTEKGKITVETSSVDFWTNAVSSEGESYISLNGQDWEDIKVLESTVKLDNLNLCVKAITEEMDVPGDINADGGFDLQDLSIYVAHMAQVPDRILGEEKLKRADINQDGVADIRDVSKMVMVLAGY